MSNINNSKLKIKILITIHNNGKKYLFFSSSGWFFIFKALGTRDKREFHETIIGIIFFVIFTLLLMIRIKNRKKIKWFHSS